MKVFYLILSSVVSSVRREISYISSHLAGWMRDEKISITNLTEDIFSTAKVIKEPYGIVLIIGAWNYPFSLLFRPLIGAISAGNVACIKPSEIAPACSALIFEMISKTFVNNEIVCVQGDERVTKDLLLEKWDYIFFTGSTAVGKKIMAAASNHLTNLTLELGGKCPVIVDLDVDLDLAAKRIVFGKFMNVGQSCTAPDHVYVPKSLKDKFIGLLKVWIKEFYGDAEKSDQYSRIISVKHFDRLDAILSQEKDNIIYGGDRKREDKFISPTIIDDVTASSPCMQEELFGPIIPIITYEKLEEILHQDSKPLALYLFTERESVVNYVASSTSSGAFVLNDVVTQNHVIQLPFGGVGESGFGKYHGKSSFDTFTHSKSFYERPTIPLLDNAMRYPPHEAEKLKWADRLDFNIHLGCNYTLSNY